MRDCKACPHYPVDCSTVDWCKLEVEQLEKENTELKEQNELLAKRITELQADKGRLVDEVNEKHKCCKNIYAASDKNSNSVPCYTIYNCRNRHRKELADD